MTNNKNINLPIIPKENAFTAIRIICALIVLYEHFVVLMDINFPCLEIRNLAVNVFFILSGFWVTRSFFNSRSLVEFYSKRVKKIFPPYLLVILCAAVVLVFMSSLDFYLYFMDRGFWKYLAANICTLNFLHPSLPGVFNGEPVNGSLWTIKVELGFYVVLPIIIFLCVGKRENNSKIRCIAVITSVYLLSGLYVILIPYVINSYHLPFSIANQLPAYLSYFSTGIFCFFFFDKLHPLWNKLIIPCAIVLIICVILKNLWLSAFLEPIVLCVIVMWSALKAFPLFIFAKIYDFSYWLYLVHYPIIMVIKYLC